MSSALQPALQLDFARYQALLQFHAEVAATLDAADWARWPDYFLADGIYRLQPRENFERGFPLATLAFDSQAMMRDRVYGITETIFHDPYYQRHVIGAPLLRGLELDAEGRELYRCESSYAVFRTKLSAETTVYNVGRYLDRIVVTPDGLRFAERQVIYDSELIPNSLIYPI
ncbi:MAG: hypothetical protein RJA44_2197 [Pseudomonadota bacterium]